MLNEVRSAGTTACAHRVLVVDDDEALRDTVKELLEMEGFEVSVAQNGRDALESIATLGPPCFVLLDLMMPVMDGPAFLEAIAREPQSATGRLPIVVFSALQDAQSLASRYGCDVLPKPVALDRLVQAADRYCSRRT